MNTEIVVVGEDATRGEVVDYIRFHEIAPDQLDNIVLINRDAALAGTVPIARLVLAVSDQRMAEIVFEPLLSVIAGYAATRMSSRFSTNTICAAWRW